MEQELIKKIVSAVLSRINAYTLVKGDSKPIPVGVSNRHVHLSKEDMELLFGKGYELRVSRDLSQPGQYAAVETVMLAGSKGCIEHVRILGPVRRQTQVEISRGDCHKLGIDAPVRESGKLSDSTGITIIGPKGSVRLAEGVIIAQRHIHMTQEDAALYGVSDGQPVMVRTGEGRGLVFDNVVVRISNRFILECHIDLDEANAAGINNGDQAYLLTPAMETQSFATVGHEKKHDCEMKDGTLRPLSIVTDEIVRRAWKSNTGIVVSKDTIYTPLARDTIKEMKVELIPYALDRR